MIWIALGVVVLLMAWVAVSNRTARADRGANDIAAIAGRHRTKIDLVRAEIDRVFAMAEDLYAHPSRQGAPLDNVTLRKALDNVMRAKLLTAIATNTAMVHVVTSPIWIRVICKDRPTLSDAVVHEYWRLGQDQYGVEHRRVPNFDDAISAFNTDSQRVFAELDARRDLDHVNKVVP